MAEEFTRWFPAVFFTVVAAFYTIRILVLKARGGGSSPVFAGRPLTPHFLTHAAFRVFRLLILGVCIARAVAPSVDAWLGPIAPLWHPEVMLTGNALMAISFGLALVVHFHMAADWRSGVPEDGTPHLLTSGPFRYSRNPAMITVQLGQLGLFLSIPSLFTLLCLIVGVTAVHVQVWVEERALAAQHGAAYEAYRERTPRWFA